MLERIHSKGNTPPLLVEVQTCTATLEMSMVVSQKTGNQHTSRLSNTTLEHISKKCSIILWGHLHNYVHSNVIHNSQNLETTYMALNQIMDKENVAHLHNGVLLSGKKQWHFKMWMKMDGKNHPEWGNPDLERWAWYVLTHKWILKWSKGQQAYSPQPQRS